MKNTQLFQKGKTEIDTINTESSTYSMISSTIIENSFETAQVLLI